MMRFLGETLKTADDDQQPRLKDKSSIAGFPFLWFLV